MLQCLDLDLFVFVTICINSCEAAVVKYTLYIVLISIFLASCVPLGKETKSVIVVASSKNQSIERHIVHKKILAIASAEGCFVDSYSVSVEYWLRDGEQLKKIHHLSDLEPGYTLNEFLHINGTTHWICFELQNVERSNVDIKAIIFDGDKVLRELEIKRCKRFDLCAEHFKSISSYGIQFIEKYGVLQIETLSETKSLDLTSGKYAVH